MSAPDNTAVTYFLGADNGRILTVTVTAKFYFSRKYVDGDGIVRMQGQSDHVSSPLELLAAAGVPANTCWLKYWIVITCVTKIDEQIIDEQRNRALLIKCYYFGSYFKLFNREEVRALEDKALKNLLLAIMGSDTEWVVVPRHSELENYPFYPERGDELIKSGDDER